jgi:hypothetical protein
VASYRNSVSEADLARNIDHELISYQALAAKTLSTESTRLCDEFDCFMANIRAA